MRCHILRDRVGETSADQVNIALGITKRRNRLFKLLFAQMPEAFADIFKRMFDSRIGFVLLFVRPLIAMMRRLQLGRKLVLQTSLKIRIILETKTIDEAQDCRRTDPGLC